MQSSSSSSSTLAEVVGAVHAAAAELGLSEQALPASLRELDGSMRGVAVAMTTRRFSGPSHCLTVATIRDDRGALTATVVGLPSGATGLPILGIDLIGLRGQGLPLVALDLAPTCLAGWTSDAAPVLDQLAAVCAALPRRKLPAFTAGVFSPAALVAAASVEQVGLVCEAAKQLVAVWAQLRPRRFADTDASVARWCAAELRNRKEHDALARIFGAEVARHYLEDFLFARGAAVAASSLEAIAPASPRWAPEAA